MKKKRQLVVDKQFQVKLAASLTAIVAVIVSIIIFIIALTSLNNSKKLDVVVSNQKALTANQNEIFKTLIYFSKMKKMNTIKISADKVNQDMKSNQNRLDENISIVIDISKSNYNLIIILIAFVVIQSGILFYILIKRSHRISGPIFLMNRYIDEIKNGKYPEIRPLRSKDDFKVLFENFKQMVEGLKNNG